MRWRGKRWTWPARLRKRRQANVAVVALANKMARIYGRCCVMAAPMALRRLGQSRERAQMR